MTETNEANGTNGTNRLGKTSGTGGTNEGSRPNEGRANEGKPNEGNRPNDWNASLYDRKLGFVAEYGADLVRLLRPQAGETVLDVGCGTGDLAKRIADHGAAVIGIDASPAMIESAAAKHPGLDFRVARAESFRLERPVDAVFSNAALHWVTDARGAAACMFAAAKPGGRLVAELGGKGNVTAVADAIERVLTEEFGIDAAARNPWYFPSVGEYASVLESVGWDVVYTELYDRPTALDGPDGLHAWLDVFAQPFLEGLPEPEQDAARAKDAIAARLAPTLYNPSNGVWTADYRRLRVIARKP